MDSTRRLIVSGTDRNLMLRRLEEGLRRQGATDFEVVDLMREFNQTRCNPPLPEMELMELAHRCVLSPQNPSTVEVVSEKPTDEAPDIALFSHLPREQVNWLWPGRIPLGKVTVLAGEPDVGKSLLSFDIAARVSRGADWPDATGEAAGKSSLPPGRVLLLNADDNLTDVVAARLEDAGAIMEHVVAIKGITSNGPRVGRTRRDLNLGRDLPTLRAQLESRGDVRLVIVDPVTAYCGRIGRNQTAKSRRIVAGLSDLAAEFNVAMLLITDPRNTGIPSRVSWSVQRDPFDRGLRLWSPLEFHYGPPPCGLGFRFGEGRIEWDRAPVRLTSEALAGGAGPVRKTVARLQLAVAWLRQFLEAGPRESTEIYAAGGGAGLSAAQLWRAKGALNVQVAKAPQRLGKWFWELKPEGSSREAEAGDRLVSTPG